MITAPNKPNLFRLDNFCDCLLNIYKNELNYQIEKNIILTIIYRNSCNGFP